MNLHGMIGDVRAWTECCSNIARRTPHGGTYHAIPPQEAHDTRPSHVGLGMTYRTSVRRNDGLWCYWRTKLRGGRTKQQSLTHQARSPSVDAGSIRIWCR